MDANAHGRVVREATATLLVNGRPAVPQRRALVGDAFRFRGDRYVYHLDLGDRGLRLARSRS